MSGPVNPIVVVQTNLPGYRTELQSERARLIARVEKIDADLLLIDQLAAVLGLQEATPEVVPLLTEVI